MKLARILILCQLSVILFLGCAAWETSYKDVDPDLVPYVNEYLNLLDKNCSNKHYNTTSHYRIGLYKRSKGDIWVGLCTQKFNGYRIKFDADFWEKASDPDRYQLVFHEMAHCLIDKGHVNDRNNYMNPEFVRIWLPDIYTQAINDIKAACSNE